MTMHHMIRQAAERVRRAIDARGSIYAPVLPSDLGMLRTLTVPPAPTPREARRKPPERPVHVLATELERLLDAVAPPAPPPPASPFADGLKAADKALESFTGEGE